MSNQITVLKFVITYYTLKYDSVGGDDFICSITV